MNVLLSDHEDKVESQDWEKRIIYEKKWPMIKLSNAFMVANRWITDASS